MEIRLEDFRTPTPKVIAALEFVAKEPVGGFGFEVDEVEVDVSHIIANVREPFIRSAGNDGTQAIHAVGRKGSGPGRVNGSGAPGESRLLFECSKCPPIPIRRKAMPMANLWSIHAVSNVGGNLTIILENTDDKRLQPVVVSSRQRVKNIRDVCNEVLDADRVNNTK